MGDTVNRNNCKPKKPESCIKTQKNQEILQTYNSDGCFSEQALLQNQFI